MQNFVWFGFSNKMEPDDACVLCLPHFPLVLPRLELQRGPRRFSNIDGCRKSSFCEKDERLDWILDFSQVSQVRVLFL